MADVRRCEQCGAIFVPRREHARFCSARCRAGWDLEKLSDPTAGASALQWSVSAMSETIERLPGVRPGDRPRAYTAISEMVWWVTIVDATLMRHHPDAYDGVLAAQAPADRDQIEGTFGGLRFVRNRMRPDNGYARFIRPRASRDDRGEISVTRWTWQPVPEPSLVSLLPRGQAWELTRYRAYQAYLSGHTIGEVLERAAAFLKLTAASATSPAAADRRRAS
jgi:hypothetical protein